MYFKHVFGWLSTTFDKLKKEEIIWKKENNFEVIEEERKHPSIVSEN
jgi:hypothetical protein